MAQVKRFEDVLDCCEAYTPRMHNELALMIGDMYIGCFEVADFDWFTVGLHSVNRRSEWGQEKFKNDTTKYERSSKGEAQAFILTDIEFAGKNKK